MRLAPPGQAVGVGQKLTVSAEAATGSETLTDATSNSSLGFWALTQQHAAIAIQHLRRFGLISVPIRRVQARVYHEPVLPQGGSPGQDWHETIYTDSSTLECSHLTR